MGALTALQNGTEAQLLMTQEYEKRRDIILQRLDKLGISYGYPGGGMYIYANISKTGLDAEEFCFELLKQQQVMIFPGTLFADDNNKHVRITLLSPQDTIKIALDRLEQFIASL